MHDVREQPQVRLLADNGIQLTKGLFREWGKDCGPYTMYPRNRFIDGKEFISAYLVYMDSVNEYEAAMRLVGDMNHWRKLTEVDWFRNGVHNGTQFITPGLLSWREDHRMKREAKALKALQAAQDNGSVPAAKYLHELSSKVVNGKKKPSQSEEEVKEIKNLLKRVK